MITVKVTCNTGNEWVTRINATHQEARDYFMGSTFVREDGDGKETADTVTGVELLVCDGFSALTNGGDYRGTYCCTCGAKESEHSEVTA